ncbi:hypothetical protein DFS34DRAFT_675133, partial [Phlyctochytrium arcticum]
MSQLAGSRPFVASPPLPPAHFGLCLVCRTPILDYILPHLNPHNTKVSQFFVGWNVINQRTVAVENAENDKRFRQKTCNSLLPPSVSAPLLSFLPSLPPFLLSSLDARGKPVGSPQFNINMEVNELQLKFGNLELETAKNKWHKWLKATFPNPLFEFLYKSPETRLGVLWTNSEAGTKDDRVTGLLVGSPGSGKTRTLVNLSESYLDNAYTVFIVSFNNHNIFDKYDVDAGAESTVPLRLLHAAYAANIAFEEFRTKAGAALVLEPPTFREAIEILPNPEGKSLVIAFDEVNLILRDKDDSAKFSTLLATRCEKKDAPIFFIAATT